MDVAVIIPTYKPGNYIWDCLESLKNQTIALNKFEVTVVLNGDKEPYYENIENYLKDSNLHYKLIYTNKKGVSNARNIGINYAQSKETDYILFLDDDDMLSSTFIEDCLSRANPDFIVVSNSMTFKNNTDSVFGNDYISKCYKKNKGQAYNIFRFRSFFSLVWGKLIPTNIIGNTRFDIRYTLGEDSLFGFTISKNVEKCVLANEDAVYYRRIRLGSASRSNLSIRYKLKNYSSLIVSYSRIFFKNRREYNFLFFLSRIIASLVHCIK